MYCCNKPKLGKPPRTGMHYFCKKEDYFSKKRGTAPQRRSSSTQNYKSNIF